MDLIGSRPLQNGNLSSTNLLKFHSRGSSEFNLENHQVDTAKISNGFADIEK